MTDIVIFDNELHNRIAALLIEGLPEKDVATLCECTVSAVKAIKNHSRLAQFCYEFSMQELMSSGAPAAVKALINIVKDEDCNKNTVVSAADKILHYSNMCMIEQGNTDKSPASMTQDEIHQRLQALQSEAAKRAKPAIIEGKAVTPDIDNIL